MKIGIDIDNVISNTFTDLHDYFNKYMKMKATPNEVQDIMRKEKLKMWGYWFATWKDRALTKVTVREDAAKTIGEWHSEHRIVLVTSRHAVFNRQTRSWLNEKNVPFHELHHAKERSKHLKANGCDIFIEDNLEECEVLSLHCKKVFLIDQPWNRREIKAGNIIRVNDFFELKAHI